MEPLCLTIHMKATLSCDVVYYAVQDLRTKALCVTIQVKEPYVHAVLFVFR